ncbi:MAG: HAMP domain-containing protein, partial [Anaerolineales bacterium]|nr:HAMP domain-containing protein [Anaerolineales bacterium]
MLQRLRSRLLLSYAFVIIVALLVVALALFAFATLSGVRYVQPLQRLASISSSTRYELLRVVQEGGTVRDLAETVAQTAVDQDVRILIANTSTRQVVYDSDPSQNWMGISVENIVNPTRLFSAAQTTAISGLFQHPENGSHWLVYGEPLTNLNRIIIFYAQRPPTARSFFREYFFRPLCGAGIAAFLLSILLALWISRSVARPLQKLANAAESVSQGDYDQPVTPTGPLEVRQVAESFNSMAAQVSMAQQAQRDFVANVSHDLKTPITSITGWSQALLDGTADSPTAQQQAANIIFNEAERMARMVAQLLDLARIESGQMALAQEDVDLRQLLNDVQHGLLRQAQELEIHLTTDLEQTPPIVGDPDRLVQVFTNLVENALKYTERNGRIHISLARYGDKAVEVRVQDTGKGIPDTDLSRIFERFYQVDKSRARQGKRGSGLGLAIVRELVELHNG